MKSPDDLALAAELRALRPTPRAEFAAELDDRAAAGFPRRRRGGAFSRLTERFQIAPRRLLAPAGGLALATVLVATVVVIGSETGSDSSTSERGSVLSEVHLFDAGDPRRTPAGEAAAGMAQPSTDGGASAGGAEIRSSVPSSANPASGPFASQTDKRAIERSAQLTLGTEPENVRRAAGKVFESVHAYDGIVLRSAIEDGSAGEAGASFELLIPSARLGDALASFSEIAEVRSRQEATADVTAKTIGLGERLQDSRATIQGLLAQLAAADTDAERVAAETELRDERFRAAALRSRLTDLERRANLSRVSLEIETGETGTAPTEEDGTWGLGDALGDAGQILEVAAGVLLIALAILAPVALLITLAWLARRTGVRRARQRALG
ncbi:MAG TPA: DUF4349 domain-containing protein [Solirubrobacterales bacterium]|nr:DUF4349 domain-containing protein [Solirubrobacterales bacterium]